MSEGGEARCYDCGKTPETCWLPPHLCKHPDREGGEAQREYNLCPGCGKTSTLYRGGWKHGGIAWHEGCWDKPSLMEKEGLAAALRACAGDRQCELDVMAARGRLEGTEDV